MLMITILTMVSGADADADFLEFLYKEHHSWMYHLALYYMKNKETAEDVLTDCWIALIENTEKLASMQGSEQKKYIFTTIKNTAKNAQKKAARDQAYQQSGAMDNLELMRAPDSVEAKIVLEDQLNLIAHEIEKLPKKEREVVYLKIYLGMDNHAIAERVGIAESSIRKYLERARNKLREKIYERRDDHE